MSHFVVSNNSSYPSAGVDLSLTSKESAIVNMFRKCKFLLIYFKLTANNTKQILQYTQESF